jgi:ADP-heptose:LPS heptosyltransferase
MDNPKKILIIQLRQLGDVLMTTPVVRQIRKQYPNAQIHFLTEQLGANVYSNSKNVDRVITIPRKLGLFGLLKFFFQVYQEKYDLVIDCFCNPKSAQICFFSRAKERIGFDFSSRKYAYTKTIHQEVTDEYSAVTKLRLIKHLGGNLEDSQIELPVSNEAHQFAKEFAEKYFKTSKTIALNVVSRRDYKMWSYKEYIKTANLLIQKGYFLFFTFGPGEIDLALKVYNGLEHKESALIHYSALTLPQLRALLEYCRFYLGNDGGIKHIAVCADIPTLTIFQTVNWINWTPPHSTKHFALTNCLKDDAFCSRCSDTSLCYKNLTADVVIKKIELLNLV